MVDDQTSMVIEVMRVIVSLRRVVSTQQAGEVTHLFANVNCLCLCSTSV